MYFFIQKKVFKDKILIISIITLLFFILGIKKQKKFG